MCFFYGIIIGLCVQLNLLKNITTDQIKRYTAGYCFV